MTPEQIKQWQDEHGGADGDPSPPDSRGLVTYRASDGAWVVVGKNGQLVSRGSKPGAIDEKGPGYTEPGQTPSAAPSSGVGPTTQQELEARVAKNPALVYRGQTLKTKTIPGLPGLGDKQIQVPVVSWVDPATGQTLTAEIGDGGAYTVTEDGIVASNKAATAASSNPNTPEGKNAAELQRQREKNAALPPEQDPAYETDKERRDRADVRIKEQGAAAKAADDKANVDADNRRADATAAQSAATAALNAGTAAAAEKRANELAGRIQDPTTKQWLEKGPDGSWRPIKTEGVPSGALPADAPQPSGRLGEAAADLQAFDQYLNAQVRSVPPKMTTDQADKLREARRSFWATALSEQQGIVNTQKGVYDSQSTARNATLSDLSNRRSSATQIADQASSDLMPLMTKMGPNAANGPSLAAAIRASRNNAMDFVTMSGANRMVPEVGMGPALTSVNGMPLPGGTAASPQMGPGFNPRGGPNALGLGAVGSVPAPGGPAAAIFRPQPPAIYPGPGGAPAVAASAAATPSAPQPAASAPSPASGGPADPRSIGAPEPPPNRPPLPATPADDPVLNFRNRKTGAIAQVPLSVMRAAADSADYDPIDPNTDLSVSTAVPTGTPGMIPQPANQMPVNAPYPNNAGAESRAPMFAPPTFLAAASRGHVHDPSGVVREMIADPRYDNATLRQVLAEQYPGYNIDALMQGAA